MKNVMLWAGAGQIGMAIARRVGGGVTPKINKGTEREKNSFSVLFCGLPRFPWRRYPAKTVFALVDRW